MSEREFAWIPAAFPRLRCPDLLGSLRIRR